MGSSFGKLCLYLYMSVSVMCLFSVCCVSLFVVYVSVLCRSVFLSALESMLASI